VRAAFAAAALVGIVLAVPAVAEVGSWRGETAQGRPVRVRTGADDLVERVRIGWRAPCEKGHYRSRTVFVPPFDVATANEFEDRGTYRVRVGSGYRARHTVFVHGRLDARDRWHGTFRVKTLVTRAGHWVDTCRLKRLRWSAHPAG
jgi:hypothetical protein